jgi:hypothetical protein
MNINPTVNVIVAAMSVEFMVLVFCVWINIHSTEPFTTLGFTVCGLLDGD